MRWLAIFLPLLGTLIPFGGSAAVEEPSSAQRHLVFVIRLEDEAIGPVTARFIGRAVEQAEQAHAECLVITLDTPGGLLDSTREAVKAILGSQVAVVVYVAPQGARAASAGVFITLASHVAAMAPGTRIGAAHPVQIGGLPIIPRQTPAPSQEDAGDEKKKDQTPGASSPMEGKIVNDTTAWARSLAELRGRNAEWAARAVQESVVALAPEAEREGVVDLMAEDLDDLLAQIDGREVTLPRGTVQLRTAGADVRTLEMWWGEQLLAVLSNPNVAFMLLILGFYGILFELYTPGWGVAGTLGIVLLVLAFFALAILPINYVGLVLIALAIGLIVAEVFVTSYGALTVGGVVCLVLGGLMLVDSPVGFQRVSLSVVVPVAAATAVITLIMVGGIVRAHHARFQTGSEALVGTSAVAQESFSGDGECYAGTVWTHGEFWKAVSRAPVATKQLLEVYGREGLTLLVRVPDASGSSGSETRAEQQRGGKHEEKNR